ncbi:MAG TPA: mobile mystery protein B [Chthonomonadaceae bacterium]|nr:mobile mystery protein B [Chthonomonadaceae bacterium]
MFEIEYPEGATPLDPDSLNGLIPDLLTQADLNEFEARNIAQAETWARRARGDNKNMLLLTTLRKLHQKMFDQTWKWAGSFRRYETNIGIAPEKIAIELQQLCDNTQYQIENDPEASWDELAVRFHWKLTAIHSFPNGNGRHARLATNILLRRNGQSTFTWGSTSLIEAGRTRTEYMAALREADQGEIERLLRFVRT